jgi:hypothetical protein
MYYKTPRIHTQQQNYTIIICDTQAACLYLLVCKTMFYLYENNLS